MADDYITRSEYENIVAKIDKIHDHIVGNGQPGLTERVRVIERFIATRIEVEKWFFGVLGGCILLGAVSGVVWLIRAMG